MSRQSDLAFAHQAQRIELGHQLVSSVLKSWQFASVSDLDSSWDMLAPQIVAQVTAAQVAAARMTTPYMDAVDRSYGNTSPKLTLAPEAFGGVMLDGREVGPALYTAVTTAKTAIRGGMAPFAAFQAGATALAVVASAALQDMGRQADLTLGQARTYTSYVRVVGGSGCSRCAILAGIWSAQEAFLRHTSCQCTTMPVDYTREATAPAGLHASPEAYFDSLSKEQQDHTFTKAGAEAIRQGANPVAVVNARRGAYGIGYSGHYNIPVPTGTHNVLKPLTIGVKADGSPLRVFATTEGTTARGAFARSEARASFTAGKQGRYRRTTTVRLMPEQIVKMAGNNPERFRELLTKYGYAY